MYVFGHLVLLVLLVSCNPFEKGAITVKKSSENNLDLSKEKANVLNLIYQDNKIVVTGSNLEVVKKVKLEGEGINQELVIDSQSDTQLIAGALSGLSLIAGKVFNLIITDAQGATSFEFSVTVSDNTITSLKIVDGEVKNNDLGAESVSVDKFLKTGASAGDVFQFDGTQWKLANLGGLKFLGTWDATGSVAIDGTDLSNINCDGHADGEYFVVSSGGTTLINGENSWSTGDWAICVGGGDWIKLNNASTVTSVFGKTGVVTAGLSDLDDVNVSTPTEGEILIYNNTNSRFENFDWLKFNTTTGEGTFKQNLIVTGTLKVSAQGVCLADGTDCPSGMVTTTVNNSSGAVNIDASSGTDDIDLKIGGVTQLKVDNTGNIGIGDLAPAVKFSVIDTEDISNGSHTITSFKTGNNANDPYLSFGYEANGTDSTANTILSGNSLPLIFKTTSTSNALTILDNGFVGIGAPAPGVRLAVGNLDNSGMFSVDDSGNIRTRGGSLIMSSGTANYKSFYLKVNPSGVSELLFADGQASSDYDSRLYRSGVGELTLDNNAAGAANLLVMGNVKASQICDEAGSNCKDISTGWASGGDFANGGDTAGADRTLGNNDAYALNFETSGMARMSIASSGDISFSNDLLFTQGADRNISLISPASGSGYSLNIMASNAVGSGAGGGVSISAGTAAGTGAGGNVSFTAGNSGGTSGTSSGTVTIKGGSSTFTGGGAVNIEAGSYNGAKGGIITLNGSGSVTTGDVTISSGTPNGVVGATGSVSISTPNITAGFSNVDSGAISITTGNGGDSTSKGGDITLTAGNGGSVGANDGGNIKLNPGAKNSTGSDGYIILADLQGNVGIGIATPSTKLHVAGDVKADNYLHTSDRRLKEQIVTIENAKEKVLSLRGVEFVWRNSGVKTLGFIAQEVEDVFPDLVHTADDGYKSVMYASIVSPVIEAFKELNAEVAENRRTFKLMKYGVARAVDENKREIANLKNENTTLKLRIERLEAMMLKLMSEKENENR